MERQARPELDNKSDDRGGKAGSGADAQSPACTKVVCDEYNAVLILPINQFMAISEITRQVELVGYGSIEDDKSFVCKAEKAALDYLLMLVSTCKYIKLFG